MRGIVSTHWLKEHLQDDHLIILDASQSSSVNPLHQAFDGKYIPGAVRFDLKRFSDQESALPNTIPTAEYFQEQCSALGINSSSKIIVYDNQGVYFSPRVWWMFNAMGHEDVAVLDGGLPAWIEEGGEVSSDPHVIQAHGDFTAVLNGSLIKSYQQVLSNIDGDHFQVIDARSEGRFEGSQPEPREGLSSGHVPGSVNVPYGDLLEAGHLKTKEEIKALFSARGIAQDQAVFSCGSGLTACIVALASYQVDKTVRPVYDGSWTEWAQIESSPISKKNP